MRRTAMIISILVFLNILASGQVLEEIEFGVTETEFVQNDVYQTNSDGLLYIQHDSHINQLYLEVYTGTNPRELEKVAEIRWFGTITLPLQKEHYWKVQYNKPKCQEYVKDLTIRWTPVIGAKH